MFDGIKAAIESKLDTKGLEAELSKEAGVPGFYLETERAYRSENDVFDIADEERYRLFGTPPATVWENMQSIEKYPDKVAVLTAGNAFRKELIDAFVAGALVRWRTELVKRIIPENLQIVRDCKCLHTAETAVDFDLYNWKKINALRLLLAKDTVGQKSLFTRINDVVTSGEFENASQLQIEMADKISELKSLYTEYKRNMIHLV